MHLYTKYHEFFGFVCFYVEFRWHFFFFLGLYFPFRYFSTVKPTNNHHKWCGALYANRTVNQNNEFIRTMTTTIRCILAIEWRHQSAFSRDAFLPLYLCASQTLLFPTLMAFLYIYFQAVHCACYIFSLRLYNDRWRWPVWWFSVDVWFYGHTERNQ